MADPKPFSRNGNLLAPPPRPRGKKIIGVKTEPNESQEAARKLEDSGFKVKDGQLTPTQDYGEMVALASEQRNSLSRDSKPGSVSTLGNPMGSMYAANPGFFNRGGRGGAVVSPEAARAQNIAKAKEAGTFDSIRDQYNAKGGAQMNEFGTIGAAAPAAVAAAPAAPATAESVAAQRASIQGAAAPAATAGISMTDQLINGASQKPIKSPMRPLETAPAAPAAPAPAAPAPAAPAPAAPAPAAPAPAPAPVAPAPAAPSQMDLNRQALEQGAAGIRLQREAMGQMPTVKATNAAGASINPSGAPLPGESRTIEGKYGGGSATFSAPGTPRKEGMINGMPASEALQGLANKTGIAREGDLYQPQVGAAPIKSFREALMSSSSASTPSPREQMGPPRPVEQMGPPRPVEQMGPPRPVEQMGPPRPVEQMGPPRPVEQMGPPRPVQTAAQGPRLSFGPPKMLAAETNTDETKQTIGDVMRNNQRMRPGFDAIAEAEAAKMPASVAGKNPVAIAAPPTSLNSGNKMVPTKDDITKQRASLASTKR